MLIILLSVTFLRSSAQTNTEVTPSISATPTSTLIPARDLDLLPTLVKLMTSQDASCTLPCLWGLRLGETTREQVVDFLQETGFDRSWRLSELNMPLSEYLDYESIVLGLQDNPYFYGNLIMNFTIEGDILHRIGIQFFHPDEWLSEEQNSLSLPRLFQVVSVLPEIYVERNRPTNGSLVVVYRDEGIYARYDFNFDRPAGSQTLSLNFCLRNRDTNGFGLGLALSGSLFDDLPSTNAFIPFEQAFDISLEEFVQFFREHPDECLVISEATVEPTGDDQ